mgnify:CR=1 FL=1
MSRQPGRKCGDRQTSRRKLPGFCLPEHRQGGVFGLELEAAGVSDGAQIGFQPFAGHADADPPSEDKLANKKPAGMSQAGLGAKCLLMKT